MCMYTCVDAHTRIMRVYKGVHLYIHMRMDVAGLPSRGGLGAVPYWQTFDPYYQDTGLSR